MSKSVSQTLAPYAAHDERSRGRRYPEPPPRLRSEFQRDRDRIIHSTAFRRLVYKTQVFVNHEGDLYRTRLTHSIEVAQIARTIARALHLNETLAEAICLAHDLGHTPFGHAGQDALNECMKPFGGFEHNLQSLRVVDELEERYAAFPGLNLTFESREGILKHCSLNNARKLGDIGERFIKREQPSLEAQIANLADEIAYNNHDMDDGLRAGLITLDELQAVPLFGRSFETVTSTYPNVAGRRLIHEIIRRMINRVVTDLVETTTRSLNDAAPASVDDVRMRSQALAGLSEPVAREHQELKLFLRDHVYRHYRVLRMTNKAHNVVTSLFNVFMERPELLPKEHFQAARDHQTQKPDHTRARAVADYIAGMTDRYAIVEYERLFDPAQRS
ncbi:MAG TPA: deoxyguanosinetriphosphate triphosphohydrolase [Steroidobacteraceae bacterium]|nr:deoxyguanosinetriphosphate triphosphohydrolase [Steroidobacteraceae bacterium]